MIGNGQTGANTKGKIDVFINDQTNPLFKYLLVNELKDDILLTSDVAQDDEIINVSPGHGFTGAAGEMLIIWENNRYIQYETVSVAVNAVTISHPVANIFTVAGAIVVRGSNIVNVDGSITPVDFKMAIKNFTIPIDISLVKLTMFHGTAGDDSKFGGIAELTKGMWFRKENDIDFNLGNYKNNQDFKLTGAVVEYPAKGPAGTASTDITFDLEEIFGQVMRMDARLNDVFRSQVRDLLTGLTSFKIALIGSYTDET